MLVLTGMNYENKATLYEEAMKSLKKFLSEGRHAQCDNRSIKPEPAFLAENEALLTADYVQRAGNKGKRRSGNFNYRGGGRDSHLGFNSSQRGSKNLNPLGGDGKILTCRSCGSFRHLVAKCPDSWENLSKVHITEDEHSAEHAVLFTRYHEKEVSQLGTEARNCAVLDSACSSTVCGKTWLHSYLSSLKENDREKVLRREGHKIFKFGGGTKLKSVGEYELPVCIVGKPVTVKTDVVDSDIPLLLSRTAMKEAGVKLDLENDTAVIMGQNVALNFTTSGHYCIPVDKSETVPVEEVNLIKLEELEPEKLKSALLKLHRQFAHPPHRRLVALLKDARVWKDEFEGHLLEIEQKCNLCKAYAKTPPRPVVSMPMAKEFNEKVAMDLKQYKGRWILHDRYVV